MITATNSWKSLKCNCIVTIPGGVSYKLSITFKYLLWIKLSRTNSRINPWDQVYLKTKMGFSRVKFKWSLLNMSSAGPITGESPLYHVPALYSYKPDACNFFSDKIVNNGTGSYWKVSSVLGQLILDRFFSTSVSIT